MQSFREKILAALPHEYRLEDAPGLAIMGRADGVQPLQLQMGKASIEHDGPFTTHTVSHVASITKQFTAYIIAQLIQEGALKPQTRASEVLPNFPGCGADITVDHLVHHTSGLRDQWDLLLMAGWRLDDVITTDHIWKLIQTQQALNFEPGAEILYSNTGYSVLAKIIEHITAQDFPRVVRERITQPLGLSRTFALVDHRRIVKGRAFGYRLQSDGFARNDHSFANTGATSLFSNAAELLSWAHHLNQLANDGSSLGQQLHTPALDPHGKSFEYAYGARVSEESGTLVMYHDGWDAGYRAAVVRIPSKQLAVTLVTNGLEVPAIQTAFDAVEAMLGTDDFRPERVRNIGKITPSDAGEATISDRLFSHEQLTGIYRSEELATAYEVQSSDGRLFLAHSRHPTEPLEPAHEAASYDGPNWMPHIVFHAGADGDIDRFAVQTVRIRNQPFTKVK